MNLFEKLIRAGLIIMVLLSLYFSTIIWISSSVKEPRPETETQVAAAVKERAASDAFLPIRLVRTKEDAFFISTSESLIASVQRVISDSSFGKLDTLVKSNQEEYNNHYLEKNDFELLYEGEFSLREYLSTFDIDIDLSAFSEDDPLVFSRIQINYTEGTILFFDLSNWNVYTTHISINKTAVEQLLDKESVAYFSVAERTVIAEKQYYMVTDLRLKKYSYILASQPVSLFRNAFFNNSEDVHTNDDSKDLLYTSGTENLRVEEKTNVLYFNGGLERTAEEHTIYSDSFEYVKKLGGNIGNVRYFDRSGNRMTYRTFVEGFPVFSENNKGQVKVAVDKQNTDQPNVTINTSLDMIQVPIPSEEEVTLMNTSDLLSELVYAGADENDIQSLIIGYTWQTIEGITQVVDLTPEWYILYKDQWYPEGELLEKLATVEVE
ncbi:YycH family regulatory protein [Enterococcus sp. LJL128]